MSDGRVVLITGGSRGIGLACARAFAAEGATVVAADRDADRLAEVDGLVTMVADVGSEDGVAELVHRVESEVGPIDLWFSNAGVALGTGLDSTADEWDTSWRVNAMAHVWAARHVVPRMLERGHGYVVSTASAARRWCVTTTITATSTSTTWNTSTMPSHGARATRVRPTSRPRP